MGCSKTMTVENIKALLDACYQAKRARELLPELPKGVSSSYIRYLDTIEGLERQGIRVKVSDISDALNIPCPGVIRTVQKLYTVMPERRISLEYRENGFYPGQHSEKAVSVHAPGAGSPDFTGGLWRGGLACLHLLPGCGGGSEGL